MEATESLVESASEFYLVVATGGLWWEVLLRVCSGHREMVMDCEGKLRGSLVKRSAEFTKDSPDSNFPHLSFFLYVFILSS